MSLCFIYMCFVILCFLLKYFPHQIPPNTQTTAYIGSQLHSVLEKFKPKVTTHSSHGHHPQQTMQPSVEMFCIQKPPHSPVTVVLNSWGPDCISSTT